MEQPMVGAQIPVSGTAWRPRTTFGFLVGYFTLYGIVLGGQGVLWADLVFALGLSKTTFGNLQFISPLVAVTLMLLGSQLGAMLGKKRLALASFALNGVAMVGLGLAANAWMVAGIMLVVGMGAGITEIAMNGGAMDWEQATGRVVMNGLHAAFSAGAVLGSFGAGVLLGAGWTYAMVFVLIGLLCAIMFVAALPVIYPPSGDRATGEADIGVTLRLMWSRWTLIGLALISALGVIGFMTSSLWQVIYLRELGAPSVVSGMALGLFNSAMFVGRLVNAPVVARRGPWFSLGLSGSGMVAAAVLLLLPGGVPTAIAAFIVLGIACAGVVPTVLSVGARLAPGKSSSVTGGIMAVPYVAMMILPGIMGVIADHFSLRLALMVIGLAGLGILLIRHRLTHVDA